MKTQMHKTMSRRRFLAGCGKMTGIGAMSSILSLKMTNKLFAARATGSITDYKGLVCLFMFGGNDSFNMLTPGVDGYSDYLDTRGILGISQAEMHQIFDGSQDYHLSPNMGSVKTLFDNEELSFIANVGTLIQPTSLAEYNAGSVSLPYGRFSHNDQIEQWQTSISLSKTTPFAGTGWAGRMIDVLNDAANNNATTSVSLSPYGANTTQVGKLSSPFNTYKGVDSLDLYDTDSLVKGGMDATLEMQYASVLHAHHNYIREDALEQSALLEDIEQNTVIATAFPDSGLGQQLLQVAKYIKAQGPEGLNANRQTFFVGQGGFDTHGGGIEAHNGLMASVSAALMAFNEAMKEIGYHDRVVTYTASDFGRTLVPNSAGSDHGWGGNQMVMGGPVNGGKVFGQYPSILTETTTDVGRGRQLPTTSVDEFYASLAYWFGVENNSEMEEVVPNIRNFWTAGSSDIPISGLFG
ncbi:DUF1501 domain-containing protein [Rubritalea spongiae]|uniref:DUF1501 domain-containing protein n=1 Tax=Rubritalea spongiae TaxID=430797 RepID=A0ABW5E0F4_9BACT